MLIFVSFVITASSSFELWIDRLKRIVERIARGPGGLPDNYLTVFCAHFELVDRCDGALSCSNISEYHKVFAEINRVDYR